MARRLLARYKVLTRLGEAVEKRQMILAAELDKAVRLINLVSSSPDIDSAVKKEGISILTSYSEHIEGAKKDLSSLGSLLIKRARVLASEVEEARQKGCPVN